MPYLGNEPFTQYSETKTQVLTGNGTVGPYTLDYEVGSVGDVEVFVNNVRQQGGSSYAYTVSGNQLTMTGAVAASDDFYVVFQGKATPSGQIPEKESNGDYNFDNGTLFVDASTNRVGIGNTTPSDKLVIQEDSTAIQPLVVLKNDNTTADNGMSIDFSGKDTSSNNITYGRIDLIVKNHATEKSDMRFYTRNDSGTFTNQLTLSKDEKAIFKGGISMNGETSASNMLDDYEEGTWTPTDATGQGTTWTLNRAAYTKIGNTVYLQLYISAIVATTSSAVLIGGLPFACVSHGWSPSLLNTSDSANVLYARAKGGTSTIDVRTPAGGTTQAWQIFNGDFMVFQLTYNTTA